MFDEPTMVVYLILLRSCEAAGSWESNRYILVCSTPLPRQP